MASYLVTSVNSNNYDNTTLSLGLHSDNGVETEASRINAELSLLDQRSSPTELLTQSHDTCMFDLDLANLDVNGTSATDWQLSKIPSPFSAHDPNLALVSLQIPAPPPQNLDNVGVNYFLANYVLPGSGPCPGFLNYTHDILADTQSSQRELAQAAVCAAGLATLASTTKAISIMRHARTTYNDAITHLHNALADPACISSDTTLFAVLVLGLFESITCRGEESLEAWKNHINGAATLIVRRGTAQFATTMGLRIFGEAVAHVFTLCSRYGHPVPPRIRFLRVEMERRSGGGIGAAGIGASTCNYRGPSWTLGTAHIEVMDLYHRVNPEAQETAFLQDEWETLLSQAAALDRRLESLVADLPVSWRFKTVNDPGANADIVYRGTYHVYYNTWVAKVWDGIRACRIILNQAIYCLLLREALTWAPHELVSNDDDNKDDSKGGGAYVGMLQRISTTTTEMRDGILASVPQMLGFVDVHQDEAQLGTFKLSPHHPVPASGAYFVLWYLFLAGSLPINAAETRAWVVGRLRAIRAATGIQKAGYLADVLENHPAFLSAVLPTDAFIVPSF